MDTLKFLLYTAWEMPEYVFALMVPLCLVALMFSWRVQKSFKKQKKVERQRERLLKKLKGREDIGENEDEVVAEAIRLMEEKAKKCN